MGISIGLVGLGSFGRAFADLFKAHPLVDRVALCDREGERMKAFAEKPSWGDKFRPRDCYDSIEGILKADLDALVVITQPWLHGPQCVQAMQAGKSVYCAVPIVQLPDGREILDWCEKLLRTVERTGKHFMMGETTYYRPEAMFCRRQAAAGAFGHFVYCEGEYLHSFDAGAGLREVWRKRMDSAAGREWRLRLEDYRRRGKHGGPMLYPTHSVSGPMCVMRARPLKVSCFGQRPFTDDPYFQETNQEFANQTALFQMSNGSVMRICEHRECSAGGERFRIFGTQAYYKEEGCWRHKRDKAQCRNLTVAEMRDPLPPEVLAAFAAVKPGADVYGGHGGSHPYLVHEFVDAVAHDRTPAVNVWESIRYMAAGVMAHESALRDGEVLAIPDWGDAPTARE